MAFLQSNDPYVQDKYDLEDNQIYFFPPRSEGHLHYARAFKRNRWLEWIALTINKKYVQISERSYEQFLRSQNPHLVVVLDGSEDSDSALQKFTSNYEAYFETVEGAICDKRESGCREFIRRIGESKFDGLQAPFMFILTVSSVTEDTLVYFPRSRKITKKSLSRFIKDFSEKEIDFSQFSEPLPVQVSHAQVQTLTRNSMTDFFLANYNRDFVVLYFDSRLCQQNCRDSSADPVYCHHQPTQDGTLSGKCQGLLKKYETIVAKLRGHSDPDGEHIRYGSFDMGKNSYHVYQLGKQTPLMRLYKMGRYNNYVDHQIPKKLDTFENDIVHFLLDTSTEDLQLHEMDEDI